MYTMYYSFSNIPFHKEVPPDKLFESVSLKEGLARMEHLKRTRGIGLIAGESGSGKTSVIRAFSGNLNSSLYKVVYFPLSTVSPNDFYRGLLYGLGEIPKSKKIDMFGQIHAAILTLYKNQKITPVIVLDEMHLASNAFLDDISLLFNFYMDSENPYILCLIGLPHLLDRLRLMQFQPLEQRIVISTGTERCNLTKRRHILSTILSSPVVLRLSLSLQLLRRLLLNPAVCQGLSTISPPTL